MPCGFYSVTSATSLLIFRNGGGGGGQAAGSFLPHPHSVPSKISDNSWSPQFGPDFSRGKADHFPKLRTQYHFLVCLFFLCIFFFNEMCFVFLSNILSQFFSGVQSYLLEALFKPLSFLGYCSINYSFFSFLQSTLEEGVRIILEKHSFLMLLFRTLEYFPTASPYHLAQQGGPRRKQEATGRAQALAP